MHVLIKPWVLASRDPRFLTEVASSRIPQRLAERRVTLCVITRVDLARHLPHMDAFEPQSSRATAALTALRSQRSMRW